MKFLVLFPDYNMVSDASINIKAVDIANILGKKLCHWQDSFE